MIVLIFLKSLMIWYDDRCMEVITDVQIRRDNIIDKIII